MIRILCIAATLLLSAATFGQGRYVIYKVQGDVTLRKHGDQHPVAAERHMNVTLLDRLDIGSGGSVSILDAATNRIYRSTDHGTRNVKNIIDRARQQSQKSTALLLDEMARRISERGDDMSRFAVAGATVRGRVDADTVTLPLYNLIASLAGDVGAGRLPSAAGFSASRIPLSDDEFALRVLNRTRQVYAVQIIAIDKTSGAATLCIDTRDLADGPQQQLLIAPGQEAALPWTFAAAGSDVVYLLLAVDAAYDSGTLQTMLRNRIPAGTELYGGAIATTVK